MSGRVLLVREGPVARVTIDRPDALNAMTFSMYAELAAICHDLAADPTLRAVLIRGAGRKAFVAGSDISQFRSFAGGQDGLAYEAEMDRRFAALEAIPVPVVAAIEGFAVGGGLALAACCDIRVAAEGARFGVPIARTVGNCLSMQAYARVADGFGVSRAKRMLMLGELLDASEALAAGFLTRVVPAADLDREAEAIVARLLANAPITLSVTKQALARVASGEAGDGADLIARTYGSADFRRGVAAFIAKTTPEWTGE